MKTPASIVSSLLAAALAGAAVYAVVSYRKQAQFDALLSSQRTAWESERGDLERALARAQNRSSLASPVPLAPVDNPPPAALSPEAILKKLQTLAAHSRDPKSIRRVIHHLEQLADLGPEALPAIRTFLARFEDVDYLARREDEGRAGENRDRGGRRLDLRMVFPSPPSLRLGLFDVVQSIGGPEAEQILAETLSETGRAVEVAYLSKLLQEMAPGKHAAIAVAAAQELLLHPSDSTVADRLDENSREFLYQVLATFSDTSFASTAQTLLVSQDGQIDRLALRYLDRTLKDGAMPSVFAAFNDPRVTNRAEKAELLGIALNHAGSNPQANEMFHQVVSDDSISSRDRSMAVVSLARGDLPPEVMRSRLPVLEALKGSTTDERVQRALSASHAALENRLAGNPVDEQALRSLFRGDRGDRGDRGGEGRSNRGN